MHEFLHTWILRKKIAQRLHQTLLTIWRGFTGVGRAHTPRGLVRWICLFVWMPTLLSAESLEHPGAGHQVSPGTELRVPVPFGPTNWDSVEARGVRLPSGGRISISAHWCCCAACHQLASCARGGGALCAHPTENNIAFFAENQHKNMRNKRQINAGQTFPTVMNPSVYEMWFALGYWAKEGRGLDVVDFSDWSTHQKMQKCMAYKLFDFFLHPNVSLIAHPN